MTADSEDKQYIGDVVRKPFARGSKSERSAVTLVTRAGEYVLRREGAPGLVDPVLVALVGKRIRVRGVVHRHVLIVSSWEETT